jgi:hypothetical protein
MINGHLFVPDDREAGIRQPVPQDLREPERDRNRSFPSILTSARHEEHLSADRDYCPPGQMTEGGR